MAVSSPTGACDSARRLVAAWAVRERNHFLADDGEGGAGGAGASSLDLGVEGKEAGLEIDLVDFAARRRDAMGKIGAQLQNAFGGRGACVGGGGTGDGWRRNGRPRWRRGDRVIGLGIGHHGEQRSKRASIGTVPGRVEKETGEPEGDGGSRSGPKRFESWNWRTYDLKSHAILHLLDIAAWRQCRCERGGTDGTLVCRRRNRGHSPPAGRSPAVTAASFSGISRGVSKRFFRHEMVWRGARGDEGE